VEDVRDKPYLSHEDVLALNFIREPSPYLFRRHHRSGLRSHIMEVLRLGDLELERTGILQDGLRRFPRAKPLKMLRIFRTRFEGPSEAEQEIGRVKLVLRHLEAEQLGMSNEFLVDYNIGGGREPLLCGLQEYVEGEILDPWSPAQGAELRHLASRLEPGALSLFRGHAEGFVRNVKRMILESGHVPDLAGVGNLLVTRAGRIKLVDINNISRVFMDRKIRVDDRGYPVCDKSIQALALLEEKVLGRPPDLSEVLYRIYLDPGRIREVKAIEKAFHLSMKEEGFSEAGGQLPFSTKPGGGGGKRGEYP